MWPWLPDNSSCRRPEQPPGNAKPIDLRTKNGRSISSVAWHHHLLSWRGLQTPICLASEFPRCHAIVLPHGARLTSRTIPTCKMWLICRPHSNACIQRNHGGGEMEILDRFAGRLVPAASREADSGDKQRDDDDDEPEKTMRRQSVLSVHSRDHPDHQFNQCKKEKKFF